MKKFYKVLFVLFFFFIFIASFILPLPIYAYNGSDAVSYAEAWVYSRNSYYLNCDIDAGGGGDCTNFVSQCVRAGGIEYMWYGDRNSYLPWWFTNALGIKTASKSFINATTFIQHFNFVRNSFVRHVDWLNYGSEFPENPSPVYIGDVMQIARSLSYPPTYEQVFHSRIVVGFSGSVPYCAQHTTDSWWIRWDLTTGGHSIGTLGKYVRLFFYTPTN